MPLPNILEFIGNNVTQAGFKAAQEELLNFLSGEAATKVELSAALTPKADKKYVDTALSSFQNGAIKTYTTLAAANADIANIALNTKVSVLSAEDGGDYYKASADATSLTKSPYDPVRQAEEYSDTKAELLNGNNIAVLQDINGRSVIRVMKDGKFYIIGLSDDVATLINKLDNLVGNQDSSAIFEVRDLNGNKTLAQNTSGDLLLPNIGNLTLALNDLEKAIQIQSGINVESAHLSGKYADHIQVQTMENYEITGSLLTAATVNSLGIFPHTVTLLRIPAVSRIGKTKYLLFFEAREDHDDLGMNSQGTATFDIDPVTNTATVSNLQSLHSAFLDGEGKLRTFMNACAVKLDSGKIVCLYVRRHSTIEHQLYMRTSEDDGATWSDFTDITSVKGATGWNLLCPCSQGLVKRYGKHKGRIVFPLWTSGAGYAVGDFRAGYIYSDDDGITWNLGEFAEYPTANEVQCAEDLNGDLLFSIRMENNSPSKIIARHSDITKKYTTIPQSAMLSGRPIMSGLIQGDNIYDRSATKFQLTACKGADRSELLVHTSYDGGANWETYLHPATIGQPVSYTCIENISSRLKLLVWESDYTMNLKYSVVALSNLIGKED